METKSNTTSQTKVRFGIVHKSLLCTSFALLAACNSPVNSQTGNFFIVDGEEDLLVLPVLEYAPIGSILYYGQPGKGIVEVVVTNTVKKEAKNLLSRFT